ncbi:hypothetical protein EDD21DRAFT_419549 [Dissophora ornata]|nr:hypothetical protein EDD21DRAFT_419549 [Dissophora ornata]
MNNGSSLSSPSARPPVEQSSSNFNLRVLDDGLLNTGSFSRKSSLAPSDSASQMINDNLKNPPRVPGLWEGVFRVRRIKEEGKRVFRFHCLQPGCKSTFAASSSSTTLTYHIKSKHRDFYQQRSQGKGVDRSSLTQTTLDMSLVPEAKQNKIKAALEWVIGDLLPFSTLDSELFQAMARSNISNMKPPCGATVRDLLLDHRMTLVARLKGLMDRTLVHGAITVDGWSSRSNRTYLEITFHWLDGDFRAHDCALDLQPRPFPHAAADIASFLRR